MLTPIADSLKHQLGSTAQANTLPYMVPAFGKGKTYVDSKSHGLTKAQDLLADSAARCSDIKFALTGYCQGTAIAADLASEVGTVSLDGGG